jgi:GT2 family glycosyltransferase
VVVADGQSEDRTREVVTAIARESSVPIRLVENPARRTPEGLNAGIAASRGQVIMIMGAHARAAPGAVSASVDALRATGAAAAGGPIETRGETDVARAIAAALSHPFGVGDARFRYAETPAYVDTVAFAAYRREVFDLLGGFDPDRDKAEDDFFNYRIRRAGGRLYLTPAVRTVYLARSSFPAVWRQYMGYGRAKGRAAIEAPRSIRLRHLAPSAAVLAGGALVLFSPWSTVARLILVALAATYAIAAAVSAFRATSRRGQHGRLAPLTAAVFPVVHTAYGLGLLLGARRTLLRR